jgi:ABC-type transport system involved in multi-copper enzyme maturation permease subunit
MTPPQPGMAPPASPFGWTGIKNERYTRWNGKLDDRKKIITRMISESVRFNVKTAPVIILIVLSWVFSMLFPVLSAGMGALQMEANTPNTWTGSQAASVGMHQMITNDTEAVYPLRGAFFTNMTQFATINVPMGWAAYINATNDGVWTTASLVVIPPHNAPPMDNAMVQVSAKTGRREDYFSTITTIAPDPFLADQKKSYEMDLAKDSFNGKAGEKVKVEYQLFNSGTVRDDYNISINDVPTKWSVKVFVNGTTVTLKSKTVPNNDMPPQFWPKVKYFMMSAEAGQKVPCVFEFSTREDSAKANSVNFMVNSRSDQMVAGNYYTVIQLSDTKKSDLTGTIMYDQVMSLETIWTLLLAAVIGSKMIATDLNEKSYNLYFARPLSKRDYLIGKFGTVGIILSLVTLVPNLITYSLLLLLTKNSSTYVIDHLWVWGSIFGYGIVVVLTFSTMSLAFSSMTSRRFYAAAALVVIYLVTGIMGQIAAQVFNSKYARLIGIADDLDVVGRNAFKVADNLNLKYSWYYSLLVLVVIWAICSFLVWYKIDRTEISE